MTSKRSKRIAISSTLMIVFSLLGKVMGFGREMMMSALFGASGESDAFVSALKAISLLSLPVQNAIATTFIPMLSKVEEQEGPETRDYHTNNMIVLTSIIAFVTVAIGILAAPFLVQVAAEGFDEYRYGLTVTLTRIGMPVIIFAAVVGVLTGFLHYEGRFAITGAVAIPLNIVYIGYMLFFAKYYGIYGMAVASVLGVVAQLLILSYDSKKAGFKPAFVFDPTDKYVKEAIIIAIPVLISVAINDVNIIVNNRLASRLAVGTVSWLHFANKLNTFILGVFISAITAIIFPVLSRAFSTGDNEGGKASMSSSVRLTLLITIPSMVGMFVLARPIVDIAFGRGAFTPYDVEMTGRALMAYSLALPAMSLNNLLNRVYYSIQDTKTPLYLGVLSVALNIVFNLIGLYVLKLGHIGLALGLSLSMNLTVLVSFMILRTKLNGIHGRTYISTLFKTGISSVVMGVVAYFGFRFFVQITGFATGYKQLVPFLITVGIAVVVYGVGCYIFKVDELMDLIEMIKNRGKDQ